MENDEIKKDSIDAIVIELMSRELTKALGKTQDYFEGVAKELTEQYPGKTPEEIGDIYDEMCLEAEKGKESQVETDERN